jgi:hypothetical protein
VKPLRAALAAVTLGLVGWFLFALAGGGSRAEAEVRTFSSSQQCRECHAEVFAEWEGSQHAKTWVNPAVRMLSNDFANQDCIDCHAPRPVFVTGIGNRVLPREDRRVEGVDCITCHQLPDSLGGGMAATFDDRTPPCRPTVQRDLARPELCAGCHNQHKTVDQWKESEWPARGEDCLSCHMPFRNGDPNLGRDHRFLGGYHFPMLQEAVELRGRFENGAYKVELENTKAGHSFPTDERSRAADLFWRVAGETGPAAWHHLYRIRDPYRYETDVPSTLLHAGKTLALEVPEVPAGSAIEVALFYKRSPYWEDPEHPDPEREALLLHRVEIRP